MRHKLYLFTLQAALLLQRQVTACRQADAALKDGAICLRGYRMHGFAHPDRPETFIVLGTHVLWNMKH